MHIMLLAFPLQVVNSRDIKASGLVDFGSGLEKNCIRQGQVDVPYLQILQPVHPDSSMHHNVASPVEWAIWGGGGRKQAVCSAGPWRQLEGHIGRVIGISTAEGLSQEGHRALAAQQQRAAERHPLLGPAFAWRPWGRGQRPDCHQLETPPPDLDHWVILSHSLRCQRSGTSIRFGPAAVRTGGGGG